MSARHTLFDAAVSRRIRAGEIDRRQALTLLWAGAAAALSGCSRPREEIVPYVANPDGLTPGEPQRYATALTLAGYGRGVIGITVDGRPIKIEGDPRHPASLGATDVFAEAAVLDLYDPNRSKAPVGPAGPASWGAFDRALRARLQSEAADGGTGLALLTGRIVSPTQLRQIAVLKARFPAMTWARYEPAHDDAERRGIRAAYGRSLTLLPRLAEVDVGLWLDADPLGPGPQQIAFARAFADRRRKGPVRWYAAEPGMTLSGAKADHRLAAAPAMVQAVAIAVAERLGAGVDPGPMPRAAARFAEAVADDLAAHRGHALVMAGPSQPAAVHALVAWINSRLAAPIDVVEPLDPVEEDHAASLAALTQAMQAGRVRTLIVLDANPVYDASDFDAFKAALERVPFSAQLGLYRDETGLACRWHAPLSHALESWSDARSLDGTASLVQPLIRPLYDTRSAPQVLALMGGETADDPRDPIRRTWAEKAGADMEGWWRKTLVAGVIDGAAPTRGPAPPARLPPMSRPAAPNGLVLALAPHASVWDGRYAPNAWLQECPEPFSKEVWGASLRISAADARRLGLKDGDPVRIGRAGRTVDASVRVAMGQAEGVIGLPFGMGRSAAGPVGSAVGTNVQALRGEALAWTVDGVTLERLGHASAAPATQQAIRLEGETKALLPTFTPAELAKRPAGPKPEPPTLLPPQPPSDHAWAMVIDTDACIGCNACVVACQSENNVPAIGPHEVAVGRDMHWLRIDLYETGTPEDPRPGFEPLPCMQCEHAPCEPVCPVEASVHDHEGLNVQVYNRCVGTRFCESNCPYKVRRFNFRDYQSGALWDGLDPSAVKAQRNPEVTVRARGVMEKCTYCVQRVSAARRASERSGEPIRDGDVVTACQSSCPTRAINFGDMDDPKAEVAALKTDQRHFTLLAEFGTRPRTTYLARTRNPNPALGDEA